MFKFLFKLVFLLTGAILLYAVFFGGEPRDDIATVDRGEILQLIKAQQTVVDAKWGQDISLWIWMPNEGRNYTAIADMFCRTVVRPRTLGNIYIHIWQQGTMDRMGKVTCRP